MRRVQTEVRQPHKSINQTKGSSVSTTATWTTTAHCSYLHFLWLVSVLLLFRWRRCSVAMRERGRYATVITVRSSARAVIAPSYYEYKLQRRQVHYEPAFYRMQTLRTVKV
jgi:hypothetical protein